MSETFKLPSTEEEQQVLDLIREFGAEEIIRIEQELFKQRKRLADAERELAARLIFGHKTALNPAAAIQTTGRSAISENETSIFLRIM